MGISVETSRELSGANLAFFLAILGAALAAFGVLIVVGARRAARHQASIPRVGCGEVVPGRVWRVVGKVRAAEPVVAPISGIRCAHWRVAIWRWVRHRHGGDEGDSYQEVGRLEEGADWWLEDETGRIAVDADRAEFGWKGLTRSFSSLLDSNPDAPVYYDLLRKAGVEETACDFVEKVVPLDKPLLAQGKVEQFPKGPYLTGGTDLVLDTSLREERLGPSKAIYGAGVLVALIGAAMLVGALFVEREPEAAAGAPPPPPGWNQPRGKKAAGAEERRAIPTFEGRDR